MIDAPALLVAGVGLSFLGLELLTNALQESTSRTVRSLVKRSTRSIPGCALIGLLAGALVQSTSAVVTVVGSTTSAGMTTLRQALAILAFANVGTTALVFAGAINIRVAVLMAVGMSGVGFALLREFRRKAIAAVALGVALLLYGSDLMANAAGGVQTAGWFAAFLHTWHHSAAMAFTLGCLASFLTQSTTAIALMTVAVANAGLVGGPPALAMIYGANLGSTLMRMLLTRRAFGASRQVSRVQDLFKTAGAGVFVLLFALEERLHVPGVYAAIGFLPVSLPTALATANLAFNGLMALAATVFVGTLERFVTRRWPSDLGEDLGTPMYAVPEAVADAATATDLLEKEQTRMLTSMREYPAIARTSGGTRADAASVALHRRFARLFHHIEYFQTALVSKQLDEATSARLGNVQGRQKVLEMLESSLHQLVGRLGDGWRGGRLEPLIEDVIETLDFLLLCACETAAESELERARFLYTLSGDRSEMMSGVRNRYLSPDLSLTAAERALLLGLTVLFERIVWMVQHFAELLLRTVDTPPPVEAQPRPT
jgi:phosphate:Na+ symporter